jgi:hypothetical protein
VHFSNDIKALHFAIMKINPLYEYEFSKWLSIKDISILSYDSFGCSKCTSTFFPATLFLKVLFSIKIWLSYSNLKYKDPPSKNALFP